MRVGVQYVAQRAACMAVMLRVSVCFIQSTGLVALLPLVAKQIGYGSAITFISSTIPRIVSTWLH